MGESATQLESAIRDLELQLHQVQNLDPQTRKLLTSTIEEIQTKLATLNSPSAELSASSPPLASADPSIPPGESSWSSRLTSNMAEWEAAHPGLATMVTRVCDFLDQAGI